MKRKITISKIAEHADMSSQGLANIINQRRKPSWRASKRLERATGISAVAWIDGQVDREYLQKHYNPFKFSDEDSREIRAAQ